MNRTSLVIALLLLVDVGAVSHGKSMSLETPDFFGEPSGEAPDSDEPQVRRTYTVGESYDTVTVEGASPPSCPAVRPPLSEEFQDTELDRE